MYSAKQLSLLALVLAQLLAVIQGGVNDNTDNWVVADKTKNFPENAVLGGFDSTGYNLYVGRTTSGTSILPVRVIAETRVATFNSDTAVSTATTYDLLVSNATLSYNWVRSFDGYRESNAVSVGTNSTNDQVFICRARGNSAQIIGTLFPAQKKCLIRYGTLAMNSYDKYEILVREHKPLNWIPY
ncbi:uncharacterized protein LOC117568275 [Drosophila albomicans]|uniref:Uncharacterized protein LOC117568275 n=1 Tax=Drosophila albomicans TaxID=7291 RepID=A0A6P8WLV1_DROAB|nr:uncharacterized protein LOC117568275 [Drosophila albomicans]